MERLLSLPEVSALLEVAEQTIRKAISEGSLKAYKRFGRWYVFEADVYDFIRSGECSTERQNKQTK
jgi:excisionase family DNA binding protein